MHYSLFLELKTITHSALEFSGYFSNADEKQAAAERQNTVLH